MAVKSRAVAPEAETLAAYCLGQDRVEKLTHPKDINYPFKRGCSSSTESRFFSCRSLSILMYSSSWKTEQCRGCERGACLLSKVWKNEIPTGRWLKQCQDFPFCTECMALAPLSAANAVISIRQTLWLDNGCEHFQAIHIILKREIKRKKNTSVTQSWSTTSYRVPLHIHRKVRAAGRDGRPSN